MMPICAFLIDCSRSKLASTLPLSTSGLASKY